MTASATLAGIPEGDYINRRTALYLFYDANDTLLYVGVCFDTEVRWSYHAREKQWWSEVARKEVTWFDNRLGALAAELQIIQSLAPKYNITGIPTSPPEPRDIPTGPGSAYQRVADELRGQILSGDLPPGACFPSERDLRQTFNLARDTVRLAVAALHTEGLIVVRHGHTTRVRPIVEKQTITLEPGQRVETRMPTPKERREHDVRIGVPVFVVIDPDGSGDIYAGDRTDILGPPPTGESAESDR